jgi:adenylate/nucleoside-diphosphate kinase
VLHVEPQTVYKRCADDKSFDCIGDILSQRLDKAAVTLPQVAFFFQKFYNSVQSIDGSRSKWFVEDKAMASIQATLKARQQFSRDYFYNQSERRPCVMQNLNVDRCFMKASLSQYGYFCPVSWKMSKKFVSCCQSPEFCVLYRHVFYYFKSIVERDCFLRNPRNFTEKVIFSSDRNTPKRIRCYKAAELVAQEKAIMSHCPVTLKDEGKVEKGQSLLVVQFKDNRFVFGNEEKMERFFKTPGAYADAVLPVKMPPAVDPVYLVKLQQQEESITFLEQALGSIVTRGLREVGENRLKYPSLSVKETMLKLFAIFLKAENPANTNYMKEKYHKKMQTFIERCEVPEELHELADEKSK